MHGLALLLAAASVGVDYGWQPGADGAMEYIIQLEPELISALQKGEAIISEIHPDARGVRRFRIQIGTDPLPRSAPPPTTPVEGPAEKPDAELPQTEPPADPGSAFPVEDFPAVSEPLPPSDFPLSPLPENSSPPAETTSAPPVDRGGSFPLPKPHAEPTPVDTRPPVDAVLPPVEKEVQSNLSDQPIETQKPVPLPDPDRLPLEPATLPVTDTQTQRQPIPIPDSPSTRPRLASFDQQENPEPATTATRAKPQDAPAQPANRPWFLFSVTIIALLGSIGANAYLGYLFFGLQQRYQGLRREQQR